MVYVARLVFTFLLFSSASAPGWGQKRAWNQRLPNLGFKIGINFTNQVYENIPTIVPPKFSNDTLFLEGSGGYNRTGFSFLVYYEAETSRKVHLIWGGGYRQRGFLSNRKYNRLTTGYVEDLLSGQYTNNRFDNLFLDFAVKFRRDQNSKVVPFLLVGNRLDCRLGFRSDFWGNDYRRLTRLEISPLFSAGLEIPLRRLTLGLGLEGAPVERITRLTFEFEFNPGIMNGHSGAGNEPGINGKTSPNPYGTKIPVGRIVRNQSFGFQAGLKF